MYGLLCLYCLSVYRYVRMWNLPDFTLLHEFEIDPSMTLTRLLPYRCNNIAPRRLTAAAAAGDAGADDDDDDDDDVNAGSAVAFKTNEQKLSDAARRNDKKYARSEQLLAVCMYTHCTEIGFLAVCTHIVKR